MPLLKSKAFIPAAEAPKQDAPTPEQTAHVATAKAFVKKAAASETMSKADWANKDQRISRQGLFQACLQSVGLLQLNTGNTLEDYLKLVEQAAERGLQFVNKA
jgi:hypothetical protein